MHLNDVFRAVPMPSRDTKRSEPTLDDLQENVVQAQEALLVEVKKQPRKWFDPQQLRDAARNGSGGDVMMFALTDLVNQGKLELGSDLRVRLQPGSRARDSRS